MQRFAAVLFDLDGVLVDTFPVWHAALNDILRDFGYRQLTAEEYRERVWSKPFHEVVPKEFPGLTMDMMWAHFLPKATAALVGCKPMPHALETVAAVRKHHKIGVITNSKHVAAEIILKTCGLQIPVVIARDDVTREKPHPEMVLQACERLGARPSATAVVGDSWYDLEAAHAAGCVAIGLAIDADYRIESLSALPALLGDTHGPL
ncbi:MAG: HAD family hydrolase [Nanoarchaeota archaeon]